MRTTSFYISFLFLMASCQGSDLYRRAFLNEPVDFSFGNIQYEGDPFDIEATAWFIHESGDSVRTGLFYAGDSTWKFWFTGTREGEWKFRTISGHPRLDDHRGVILVEQKEGKPYNGFISNEGNKWLWSGTGKAFVPQLVMYKSVDVFHGKNGMIGEDIEEFLVGHGFNGFHLMMDCQWYGIGKPYEKDHSNNPLPDVRTFEALEYLIISVYKAGGMVHLWMWGKPQAGTSNIKWGINSMTDKKLQRYLAARLGPLPGWTLGYGWDLNMWEGEGPEGEVDLNDGKQLTEWRNYLQEQMGWHHLIGARWISLNEPRPRKILGHFSDEMDFMAYQRHRVSYDEYLDAINHMPGVPSFETDRFRIRNSPPQFSAKDYTAVMTRRGLWHSTMAGGVGNIWGKLDKPDGTNLSRFEGSLPYDIRDQIKTYSVFFFKKERFLKDLFPNNTLAKFTPGIRIEGDNGSLNACLQSRDNRHFIFYSENSSEVWMYLHGMNGEQPVIAVDTKRPYLEISDGTIGPGIHTWEAPYESDWAIAIGDFQKGN